MNSGIDYIGRVISEDDDDETVAGAIAQLEQMTELDEWHKELLDELKEKQRIPTMAKKAKPTTAAKKNAPAAKKNAPVAKKANTDVDKVNPLASMHVRYGKTRSCGDEIAEAVKKYIAESSGDGVNALVEIGVANNINVTERWGHLNNGMQRMNLGNALRGRANKGLGVIIGDFVIAPVEKEAKAAKPAKAKKEAAAPAPAAAKKTKKAAPAPAPAPAPAAKKVKKTVKL